MGREDERRAAWGAGEVGSGEMGHYCRKMKWTHLQDGTCGLWDQGAEHAWQERMGQAGTRGPVDTTMIAKLGPPETQCAGQGSSS